MSWRLYPRSFEPVRVDPGAETTLFPDKWYRPISEPTLRRGLATAIVVAAGCFFTPSAPFAETVSLDRWLRPLSEPVRFRPQLLVSSQQAFAFVKASPFGEFPDTSKWHRPLSEPSVKTRPGLTAGQQQSFIFAHAEDVTVAKWLQALSEPKRFRPALSTASQQHFAFLESEQFAEIVSIDRWRPTYPDRAPGRSLPAYEQQTFAFVKAAPFAENVTLDRWMQSLAIPVRTFRHVSLSLYESAAHFDPFPYTQRLDITSTEVLDKPVDYVLAGQQPYEFSGRDPAIPATYSESKSTMRSGTRRLKGSKPSFSSKSGPLGGSHKE